MDSMEIADYTYTSKNPTMERLISKDFQGRRQPSRFRCKSVYLGLLCIVLLAGNIGLIIYLEIISHPASADPAQASYALEKLNNTQEDRLQSSYDALTAEKKQLEVRLSNLTKENDQFQQSLATEKDKFKVSFNNLKNETDQLQASYNNLKQEHNRLQTRFNNMQGRLEGLETKHNDLTVSNNQLKTNYSSLATSQEQLQKNLDKVRRNMVCQTGWQKFDISCYLVTTLKKNWTSSRQDCIAMGADLVIIDSREKQVFVNGLLKSGYNAWIGMTDSLEEGTWLWLDGTPITIAFWQAGQPNSFNGNQDCGEIVQKEGGGEWNDDGCFGEQLGICEK